MITIHQVLTKLIMTNRVNQNSRVINQSWQLKVEKNAGDDFIFINAIKAPGAIKQKSSHPVKQTPINYYAEHTATFITSKTKKRNFVLQNRLVGLIVLQDNKVDRYFHVFCTI